jgi:hypothetical protein
MKQILAPLFALMIFSLVPGCTTKESPTSSSTLTGTLKGQVLFFSGDRADIPMPAGTATVSLEGTTLSTTTDSQGRWQFDDLPAGIYNIAFARSGFATRREIGFQFVGGGIAYLPASIPLWKQTPVTVSNLTAVLVDTTNRGEPVSMLRVSGRLNYPSTFERPSGVLIIGQNGSMTINNPDGALAVEFGRFDSEVIGGSSDGSFDKWIPLTSLSSFAPGSTVRILGYGWMSESAYYDPEIGKLVTTNFTAPDSTSFVMP